MKKFEAELSIRRKMMFIFVGLILFLLILLVFVNGTFAEWYYMANKRSDLVSIYKEISKVQEKDLPSVWRHTTSCIRRGTFWKCIRQ